ncbi:very short patch repair endonuclease [Cryobacterium lyxosi]|uniref:Very short patch repair endonuclease n=1 Tax=Cryobacterium lyxosi TaxID=1259228 RepID=A0A4R8ZCT2_9MICO|nr:very short patch repair endonuclease [Cryobacterium lyxosi]TFD25170.1 DNA mismatch endonuclease Vsr [Cryobacterium lyxosi]
MSPAHRERTISRIRSVDTKPEWIVRRLLHSLGYRYRLHVSGLPGKPDLVFTRRQKVLFVNGCFWHSHSCSSGQSTPASNVVFWASKRSKTVARDARNKVYLETLGWSVLTMWECELHDSEILARTLCDFLDDRLTPVGARQYV